MTTAYNDSQLKAKYFYTPDGIRYKKVIYEAGQPVETVYSLNGVYEETQNASGTSEMNYYYVNDELMMRRGVGVCWVLVLFFLGLFICVVF